MYVVNPGYDIRWPTLMEAIMPLAEQGVSAIEISLTRPAYFDYRDSSEIDRVMFELERLGLSVYSIEASGSPTCDISSPDDQVHEDGVVALIDAIEFAGLSGAQVVVLEAGQAVDGPTGRRLDRARGVLRETAVLACDTSVFVALKNSPSGHIAHDPREMLRLVDSVGHDNVGICFDCANAQQTGHFPDAVRLLLPLAIAARVSDCAVGSDKAVFPGDGVIPWREFATVYHGLQQKPELVFTCTPPQDVVWGDAISRARDMLSAGA